ncbi:MAG: DNA-binding transcriptional LysR family regulator [Paracoccaceae bacterium]|jgi:DNA-binding transcriptional LysR family regulator
MLRYTFRQLEYFVAVGEAGSIAVAAARVNISSPSISTAINQLEKELGLPLFVRQRAQGLSLTIAGRRMMDQAKRILQEAHTLMDLAGDISGTVRGPLSVGCLATFAQVVLPTVRRSFETENPDVQFKQLELNQAEVFSGLRRAEIDIALTYDLDLPADLQFTSLLELWPYAIVGEDHPLAHLTSVSVEELQIHPMVLLDLPFSSDYFLSFFTRINSRPLISERTKDMAVMRSLVANGFGYSIANLRPVNDRAPDGKPLKFIPLTGDVQPMQLGLLMSTDADTASVVRAFIQHCKDGVTHGNLPGLGAQPLKSL